MTSAELVPPRRLGELLAQTRHAKGMTATDVATASGGWFKRTDILAIESGLRRLDDRELGVVVDLYGVPRQQVLPTRNHLILDLGEGTLSVGNLDARLAPASTYDEVLSQYLALVYTLRDIKPGAEVPLRDYDIEVLAEATRIAEQAISSRLHEHMHKPETSLEPKILNLRRRLLLPAAGIFVGATAIGAVLMISDNATETDPVDTEARTEAPAASVDGSGAAADGTVFGDAELIPPVVVVGEFDVMGDELPVDADLLNPVFSEDVPEAGLTD